jgi:hypothetical protein
MHHGRFCTRSSPVGIPAYPTLQARIAQSKVISKESWDSLLLSLSPLRAFRVPMR